MGLLKGLAKVAWNVGRATVDAGVESIHQVNDLDYDKRTQELRRVGRKLDKLK